MGFNIKASQLKAVERMLRSVNSSSNTQNGTKLGKPGSGSWSQQWKVLIYDECCRDIISPLITVRRLRENGVTLHMLITGSRDAIPDVPAIYFIRPTEKNIHLIIEDCRKRLYDEVFLNFASPLEEKLMEQLAKGMVEVNAVNVVSKVYDQFLGFVSLEPDLFTINIKDSFVKYNNPSLVDHEVEGCMKLISQGATSAIATLGVLPIIRCPPGR